MWYLSPGMSRESQEAPGTDIWPGSVDRKVGTTTVAIEDTVSEHLAPQWDEAERMREQTIELLTQRGFDTDLAFAMGMVAGELTENAVKYGTFGESHTSIDFILDIGATEITIEVKNPVDQDSPHFRRLDEIVQWIRGFQNPFQAYVERLREVSGSNLGREESGLGLVRIAYEAQAILDFYVDAENTLALSAVYQR